MQTQTAPTTAVSTATLSRSASVPRAARDLRLRRMFARARAGDATARGALVSQFDGLARRLAGRYRRSSEPFDDLLQVAHLGLIKAIDRFDPDRGIAFTSFAVPTILGELKRHFRDTGWAVHVPRALHERALRVSEARRSLEGRLGRSVKVQEIANELDCALAEVLEAMEAAGAYEAASIDAPVRSEDGGHDTLGDTLGREDHGLELADQCATVATTMKHLPERDRRVLELRFGLDLTQTVIAERLGVSQMQVSRIIRRALERLRELAEAS